MGATIKGFPARGIRRLPQKREHTAGQSLVAAAGAKVD